MTDAASTRPGTGTTEDVGPRGGAVEIDRTDPWDGTLYLARRHQAALWADDDAAARARRVVAARRWARRAERATRRAARASAAVR
ncbi:hypothetical protein [Modestobacter sp. Leaf380]|uniref:hypothetical protein n=1 Tax=Modestobacter sp. Leaf380 TaxID=1736356 RepID=UPI0012F81E2A|nr:hypothetical protein [Modestobacter sp. Leaf380]